MLVVNDLSVSYGKINAVTSVDLFVQKGEIVTIIGPNGAGKTTLLKTIVGLLDPGSGRIKYNGESIIKTKAFKIIKKGISMVPEGRWIFNNMTVSENLDIGSYIHSDQGLVKEQLALVFALFPRLKERQKQIAKTMSGGEQQMLAIARALMNKPDLLILDEPSLGLAPILVKEVFKKIKEIHESGVTVLLVEQNANLALKTSNRAYVLERGKIVTEGYSTVLINDPIIMKSYLGV